MSEFLSQSDLAELQEWRAKILAANRHNILCHCRRCDREWMASSAEKCRCGSTDVESLCCWQFPDG
jgi:hypothetical protein